MKLYRLIQNTAGFAHAIKPFRADFDVEGGDVAFSENFGVRLARRMKSEHGGPAKAHSAAVCFRIGAAPDKAEVRPFMGMARQTRTRRITYISKNKISNLAPANRLSKELPG